MESFATICYWLLDDQRFQGWSWPYKNEQDRFLYGLTRRLALLTYFYPLGSSGWCGRTWYVPGMLLGFLQIESSGSETGMPGKGRSQGLGLVCWCMISVWCECCRECAEPGRECSGRVMTVYDRDTNTNNDVLTVEQLKRLARHRSSSVGQSLLQPYMQVTAACHVIIVIIITFIT